MMGKQAIILSPSDVEKLPKGAVDWLQNGERGISSDTIFERMTGLDVGTEWHDVPYDPADLRRCRLLLETVPEFHARIGEMRTVSAAWSRLTDRWVALCSLMDEETPNWRDGEGDASKVYAAMHEEPK
jgi:hypothetical protein